ADRPGQVELVRVFELAVVAIGRTERGEHRLALLDQHTADLDVLARVTRERGADAERHEPHQLLHCLRHEFRLGAQPREFGRVLDQGGDEVRDLAGRGLVTGSGTAKFSTRSAGEPSSIIRSTSWFATSIALGRNASTPRWVNALVPRRRTLVCSGGSMARMPPGPGSGDILGSSCPAGSTR